MNGVAGGSLPDTLDGWLARLESCHPKAIELGLERVSRVRDALGLNLDCPVITVGGTNGKGSTCAYLEAMLQDAGYRVGLYTSPHLLRYHERMRVEGQEADDAAIVAAFARVEAARGDIPLTYFEHGTLAALSWFQACKVDVAVLEVGLGGRLDAVNVVEPDCAVVTGVDLDHQEYLGPDRESIGFEKAGIFRAGRPALCLDPDPPASLVRHAGAIGAPLWRWGQEIVARMGEGGWQCEVMGQVFAALPYPAMPGAFQIRNAAAAVAALVALHPRLPVPVAAIRAGLARARQPGRFQVMGQQPLRILDVAHNPQAARALAGNLAQLPPTGRIHGVFAMLRDKDVEGVIAALAGRIHHWHVAGLPGPRGAEAQYLVHCLAAQGQYDVTVQANVADAWRSACRAAGPADTIIAFGSFHTVADVMTCLREDG